VFGRPQNNRPAEPPRPPASDAARIQGGGLVQVIVTSLSPLTYSLFLNDRSVAEMDVESLSVAIEMPDDGSPGGAVVRATLSRYVTAVTGEKTQQRSELFPCTLELVALGRRISITAMNPDTLENLWIDLGLKADGTSNEVKGAKALRILLGEGILDAKLTWEDGETEDLLPQA
jgi:hypothetical protein